MAADQGHPHASYNLAVGHLTGIKTDVEPGEIHTLIKLVHQFKNLKTVVLSIEFIFVFRHAHENGVDEASDVLVSV